LPVTSVLAKEVLAMRQSIDSVPQRDTAVNVEGGLLDELSAFRRHLRSRNRAPKTVKTYEEAIQRFVAFLTSHGMPTSVEAVRREHVEAFMEYLAGNFTAATAANRYRSLQAFWKWASTDGELITKSPMERMAPPKI